MKQVSCLLYILLFSRCILAENVVPTMSYAIDNSYSVEGSLKKYTVDFPQIRLPVVEVQNKVDIHLDQVYSKQSGRDLHIDIFKPLEHANHHAILLVHGGGWSSGNKTHLQPLAKALALKGYLTATVEYRLSPEVLYPAGVLDIYTAIGWLNSQAEALNFNPTKLSILGGSSGGHLASLVAYAAEHNIYLPESNKLHFEAVIDMDGVLDVASGEGLIAEDKAGQPDTAMARWLGGNYANKTLLWQTVSIPQYITENSPPMLFISSGQSRFKAGFTQLEQKLTAYDIQVNIINLDNTAHPFWLFEPWFSQIIEPIDQFLLNIK